MAINCKNRVYDFFDCLTMSNWLSNNKYYGKGRFQLYQKDLRSGKSNWHAPYCRKNAALLIKYINSYRENWFTANLMTGNDRKIGNLAALDTLFTDLDSEKIGHEKPSVTYKHLMALVNVHKVFKPTAVVDTGHGLHVYWVFKHQLSVNSPKIVDMWRDVENYLVRQHLAKLGLPVDKQVVDPTRILRVPGSYNTKDYARTGNPEDKKLVTVKYLNSKCKYNFKDLLNWYHKKSHRQFIAKLHKLNANHNQIRLINRHWGDWDHEKMAEQLLDLVKLRHGKMTHLRNITMHIYISVRLYANRRAKQTSKATQNDVKRSIINGIQGMNYLFTSSLPKSEMARFVGRISASQFNTDKKHSDLCKYNYSKRRIIDLLNITPKEMMSLNRLRSKSVQKHIYKLSNRKNKQNAYWNKKLVERRIHFQRQYQADMRLRRHVNQMINEHKHGWTYKKIANKHNISVSKAYRLINKIGYTKFNKSYDIYHLVNEQIKILNKLNGPKKNKKSLKALVNLSKTAD